MSTQLTNQEKLDQFAEFVFSTICDFGGMSGWIHTVKKEKGYYFIDVEDCHFIDPAVGVTVQEQPALGRTWEGELYGGHTYRVSKGHYAIGICKWIAAKKFSGIVTEFQVEKLIESGDFNLDGVDYDAGDAFDMTQYAMFGEVPFG